MCPEDTAVVNITVSESIVDAEQDSTQTVCLNSGALKLSGFLIGADVGGVFEDMSVTGQFDPVTTDFDPAGLAAGTYNFEYIVTGCVTNDTSVVSIIIASELVIDAGTDVEICIGEAVNLLGTGAITTYVWSGGIVNGVDFYPNTTAMYYVIATDPVALAGVTNGEFTNLQPETVDFLNNSTGAVAYQWNFADGLPLSNEFAPSHEFFSENSINYNVELVAFSPVGCTDTTYVVIEIAEEVIYFIPNSFKADGDEFNQSFKPVFTSGVDPFDFTILFYNRWGEVIYETHDFNVGWDGTYAGKKVQSGTYSWTLEFKIRESDERRVQSGHVTIIE